MGYTCMWPVLVTYQYTPQGKEVALSEKDAP